jgi:hypothetical protein
MLELVVLQARGAAACSATTRDVATYNDAT